MERIILFLIILFFIGCNSLPHFGTKLSDSFQPESVWKLNVPKECTVQHVVTVSFNKNNEVDLIGYLIIKEQDFRLIGINELGLTLFDVYQPKSFPFVVSKTFPELEQYGVLKNMVRDIELIFLSPYLQQELKPLLYENNNSKSYVYENNGKWIVWQEANNEYTIKEGYYQTTLREISYKANQEFPDAVEIFYPREQIKIKIEIIEVEEKSIPESKINPKYTQDKS